MEHSEHTTLFWGSMKVSLALMEKKKNHLCLTCSALTLSGFYNVHCKIPWGGVKAGVTFAAFTEERTLKLVGEWTLNFPFRPRPLAPRYVDTGPCSSI